MTLTPLVRETIEPQPIARRGVIGIGVRDARPVTVVGDDNGLDPGALEFAAEVAQRRHVALHVVQVWPAQRDSVVTAAWLATRQTELAASIAPVQARYPGLPIAAWIELMAGWIAFARAQSSLVVTGRSLVGAARARPARKDSCPVAVVPDCGRA